MENTELYSVRCLFFSPSPFFKASFFPMNMLATCFKCTNLVTFNYRDINCNLDTVTVGKVAGCVHYSHSCPLTKHSEMMQYVHVTYT